MYKAMVVGRPAGWPAEPPPPPWMAQLQLSESGDVFTSLAEGQDAYREAAFGAPPSEEGATKNQGPTDMPNPFTGAKKPKAAPCKPKGEPSVCYLCDEPIPRKRDTIAL